MPATHVTHVAFAATTAHSTPPIATPFSDALGEKPAPQTATVAPAKPAAGVTRATTGVLATRRWKYGEYAFGSVALAASSSSAAPRHGRSPARRGGGARRRAFSQQRAFSRARRAPAPRARARSPSSTELSAGRSSPGAKCGSWPR